MRTALCVEVRGNGCMCFASHQIGRTVRCADRRHIDPPRKSSNSRFVSKARRRRRCAHGCKFAVTPDPGVIEVNVHPSTAWKELTAKTLTSMREARQSRFGDRKNSCSTANTPARAAESRHRGRRDASGFPRCAARILLRSLITYWQNHPSLVPFSGTFIGLESPRVGRGADRFAVRTEIAFEQMDKMLKVRRRNAPWLVDRLLRNFLVDLTGNTHRAEFSIDKLLFTRYPTGRLGWSEPRSFEMPPHAQMSLTQHAAVARADREVLENVRSEQTDRAGARAARPVLCCRTSWQDMPCRVQGPSTAAAGYPEEIQTRAFPRIPLSALWGGVSGRGDRKCVGRLNLACAG